MSRIRIALAAVPALFISTPAHAAPIVIDSFQDSFESESVITSQAGGIILDVSDRAGLEVGLLNLANGAGVGDPVPPAPGFTLRPEENQVQAVLGGVRNSSLVASAA